MKMLEKLSTRVFTLLLLSVSGLVVSCSEDDGPAVDSPAYKIEQSEKLTIPDAVAVASANTKRVATYFATGVQKYKAQVKSGSSPVAYEWGFVAPQATLSDASGDIGTHYAGPSWELTSTGAKIMGQAYSPAKATNVDADAIDWLLLKVKDGTTSSGIFVGVKYIQRIATTGGRAPSTAPTAADQTLEVPYTAVYRFSSDVE